MLFETLAVSIVVGLIRKGKIKNIESIPVKGWPFIIAGFLVYISTLIILKYSSGALSSWIFSNIILLVSTYYFFTIIGILISSMSVGFVLISTGLGLNGLASIVNGGRMPVSADALSIAGLEGNISFLSGGKSSVHILADAGTRLYYLADIIPVPLIIPKVISIGDIILAIGIFLTIRKYMTLSNSLHS